MACKCKQCYGLYEWASENLTSTHGLRPTTKEHSTVVRYVLDLEPIMPPVRGALADHNPWIPRRSRHERHRAA